MSLVNDNAVFDIRVKGESTGKIYEGQFTLKLFLSLHQRNQIAVEFSKKDKGNEKDVFISNLNSTLIELQARTVECPAWFKGDAAWNLQDLQPILSIRDELDAHHEEYLKSKEDI